MLKKRRIIILDVEILESVKDRWDALPCRVFIADNVSYTIRVLHNYYMLREMSILTSDGLTAAKESYLQWGPT